MLYCAAWSLFTLQPHTARMQDITSRQPSPEELPSAASTVHSTIYVIATVVPESGIHLFCTVPWPPIIITVICAEHPVSVVVRAKCIIAGVTWVPSRLQRVFVCLRQYYERTVLGVVPVAGVLPWLQVEPQLVAYTHCQLMDQVVAEPVVAAWVTKTDFELRPWTIESVVRTVVLLDQQRRAVGYRTHVSISKQLTQLLKMFICCADVCFKWFSPPLTCIIQPPPPAGIQPVMNLLQCMHRRWLAHKLCLFVTIPLPVCYSCGC